jgi:hypothetical protein
VAAAPFAHRVAPALPSSDLPGRNEVVFWWRLQRVKYGCAALRAIHYKKTFLKNRGIATGQAAWRAAATATETVALRGETRATEYIPTGTTASDDGGGGGVKGGFSLGNVPGESASFLTENIKCRFSL